MCFSHAGIATSLCDAPVHESFLLQLCFGQSCMCIFLLLMSELYNFRVYQVQYIVYCVLSMLMAELCIRVFGSIMYMYVYCVSSILIAELCKYVKGL